MKCTYVMTSMFGLILFAATSLAIPPVGFEPPTYNQERAWDNEEYINANSILMFVTNHGNFGRDLAGVFGYDGGTFFPFVSIDNIESGALTNFVLYSVGLWLGGKVDGQTRVAIAEYSDEYVPGPMANGTYQPDDPSFKVYKLYRDSLADNPNLDYLNWPVQQGAPVNELGQPLMLGDQMLWSVFNDADPNQHLNDAGETAPLGIEVQQTTWASGGHGEDSIVVTNEIEVTQAGSSEVEVHAFVTDQSQLTLDSYAVDIFNDPVAGPMWQLRNVTNATV
ncbi:MAG: hypothetical protein OEV80_14160, partial [candidate division Zixibacteria bacterium]|nr:hypothetical protein [candidate division Zixibacteria bacterium]